MWLLCLHGDGLEQIESLLLFGVGHGDFGEHGCLCPGVGAATSVAENASEIVQPGPKGMDNGIVIELLGVHIP